MITKMLDTITKCRKINYKVYRTEKSYIGTLKYIETNINIVYILNNKVYVGYGVIHNLEENIESTIRNIQSVSMHQINYKSLVYVTKLNNNEKDLFMDLLKHEQKVWGNIRISTSYAEWIKNDLPLKLMYANEEAHWTYKVDSITFDTDMETIHVNVCLDNCDWERFVDYKILGYSSSIIDDLSNIGKFEGVYDNLFYNHMLDVTEI